MTEAVFLGAYIVDLIVGDPHGFPHPVVIIGRAVRWLENTIRRFSIINLRRGGIILWFAVMMPVYSITWGLVEGSALVSSLFRTIVTLLLASMVLATRSLFDESRIVIDALRGEGIVEARKRLAMIVGRDTENLDEKGILRAVIETVSENLSDGIVAPMFYLAVGGVPLAMTYKAVNTLDSMVGYKNERYKDFGWFSAKMDDIWNWIPARLTGLLIVVVSFVLRLNWQKSFGIMKRDGKNHSSPNSAVPEAAVAGALNIQLGGTIRYGGKTMNNPTIGDKEKEIDAKDVKMAWIIMFCSSFLMMIACGAVLWMIR